MTSAFFSIKIHTFRIQCTETQTCRRYVTTVPCETSKSYIHISTFKIHEKNTKKIISLFMVEMNVIFKLSKVCLAQS